MCRPPRLSVSGGYRAPFLSATACRANQKLVQLRHAHIYHIYPVFMSLWVILHIVAQISWTHWVRIAISFASCFWLQGRELFFSVQRCSCRYVENLSLPGWYFTSLHKIQHIFSVGHMWNTCGPTISTYFTYYIYHIIFHWWIAQHFDLDWKVGGSCCYCDLGREAGLEYSSCTRFANNINMIYDDYDGWWSLSWFMQFLCSYAISIHFCYITICNNHI